MPIDLPPFDVPPGYVREESGLIKKREPIFGGKKTVLPIMVGGMAGLIGGSPTVPPTVTYSNMHFYSQSTSRYGTYPLGPEDPTRMLYLVTNYYSNSTYWPKINGANPTQIGTGTHCLYGKSIPTGSSVEVDSTQYNTSGIVGFVAYNLSDPWTIQDWQTDGIMYSNELLNVAGMKNGIIIGFSSFLQEGSGTIPNNVYSGWTRVGRKTGSYLYWMDYGDSGEWVSSGYSLDAFAMYTETAGTYQVMSSYSNTSWKSRTTAIALV